MMRAGLHMALGVAVLSGCAADRPASVTPVSQGGPLRVSDEVNPLGYSDGTRAKRIANDVCGARGVESSINDRYENGVWIFAEGCA